MQGSRSSQVQVSLLKRKKTRLDTNDQLKMMIKH